MKYQLVLQFKASTEEDFEELVALEDTLSGLLAPLSEVDGHDFGLGEFNFFVFTDDPTAAFSAAESFLQRTNPKYQMKAGYRSFEEETYTVLWPPDLQDFSVA